MYRANSELQIEAGYFDTKNGAEGLNERFKYYQDMILINGSSVIDYNIYQIDSNDSISIRYTFDFGKYGFDQRKEIDRRNQFENPFENYIYSIDDFLETDRFLYFNFAYQRYTRNLLYSKVTGQSCIQSLALELSKNGDELIFFPAQAIYSDRLIAIVEAYVFNKELERMSPENIKKWGLDKLPKIDDEDNPVLIFYKTKL